MKKKLLNSGKMIFQKKKQKLSNKKFMKSCLLKSYISIINKRSNKQNKIQLTK